MRKLSGSPRYPGLVLIALLLIQTACALPLLSETGATSRGSQPSGPNLQSHGFYLQEGSTLVVMPQTEVSGRPAVGDIDVAPTSTADRPTVIFWDPRVDPNSLVLFHLEGQRTVSYSSIELENDQYSVKPNDVIPDGTYCYIQQDPLSTFLAAWCFSKGTPTVGRARSSQPTMTKRPTVSSPTSTPMTPLFRLVPFDYLESSPENGWVTVSFHLAVENITDHEINISSAYIRQSGTSFSINPPDPHILKTGGFTVQTQEGVEYDVYHGDELFIPGPLPMGYRFTIGDQWGKPTRFEFRRAEAATPVSVTVVDFPSLNFPLPPENSNVPSFPGNLDDQAIQNISQLQGTVFSSSSVRITLTGTCHNGRLEAEIENLNQLEGTDLHSGTAAISVVQVRYFSTTSGTFRAEEWFVGGIGFPAPQIFDQDSNPFGYLGPGQSITAWLTDSAMTADQVVMILDKLFDSNSCSYD